MDTEGLDVASAAELLRRQDALQAEAYQLIARLDLPTMLSRAGKPEHIGSSVSGLMAWRDIDFNVLCSNLSADLAFETMRPLITNPHVSRLHYHNESGSYTLPELRGDERYYFVTYYETEAGNEWKIDISFWLSDRPRDQLAHLEYLSRHLTDETRLAILWIKDVWRHLPVYPYQVGGTEIYDAVLEHGVRTPTQFDKYLLERGMPGR
jgi:GrpB-like predicted nucleotidyltransferase (UPF0157 family)